MKSQSEKASAFYELHHTGRILVLPNAWDVTSARIFEEAGFPAIATTSGGVSASLGYPDGQKIPREEVLSATARIASRLTAPLTADMEAGFGVTDDEMEQLARGVISAGAVGLNIEDSTGNPSKPLFDIDEQVRKIKTLRKASDLTGIRLFINARTDALYRAGEKKGSGLENSIERGKAYLQAGADSIYVFGPIDSESISYAVKKLDCPINVRAGRGNPSIPELQSLGVARASVATSPFTATLGLLKRIANELKDKGTYDSMTEGAITYQEMNRLAVKRSE